MKKLGFVLILFVTLILVGIGTVKAIQTSDSGTVLAFTILFVRLVLPPAILVTIIIAILSHREEN